jgi:hypothetical protein
MRTKYKVPDITTEEKREYLKSRGWEMSWSNDNWVRSEAKNKEANTGIDTVSAYYYQYGIDNNLRYKVKYE